MRCVTLKYENDNWTMAVHTNNNTTYYINPAYLTFVENSGYGANLIQVSASSSCYIRVFIPGEIGYDSDGNYRRWKITAYNNKFPDNDMFYIYVRLERNGTSALIVYSKELYDTDGSTEDGSTAASEAYYYIRIGSVSSTNGTDIREITYDTGRLESDQVKNEGTELNEMWELDKHSTPWLIRAKQWLSSFTVKGFITLIGGLIFKSGDTEKPVVDIKRSTDGDSEYLRDEDGNFIVDENGNPIKDTSYVPINDETIPTTKYVQSMNDDRYLSKIKPDETPYHIGLKGGLTTTEVTSTDYAKDVPKAGWAAKKNDEEEWYMETDHLIARILGRVYDLLVENHAIFKGDLSSEEFISGFIGGKGWAIRMKEWENAAGEKEIRSYAEFDDLVVRGSMRIYEFIVSQMLGENDNRIFTGMMEVDHYDAADGKVYLKTDGGKLYNPFRVDDVIIVQQYGGMPTEDNGYYVTKQYEFIVTGVGIGNTEDGEDRLDWLTFRNFTTAMEGGDLSLIAERDTLVRIDNLSDARRKGIIQMMSVGEDTPYMDFIYGAKTDPDNALKGRFGNIGGIYNPLFGWLKEFGAYLTNLYAVGEFRIAHTGEDVADAIEIAKGQFRTNYKQTTFDMTEEDNFFTNAAMTNNCEHWVMGEESTSYFLVDDLPQFFNYELYGSEDSFAGIAEHNGRDMLRLSASTILQENELIDKPGTHKVHTGTTENADGTYTKVFEEVPDTLYLSVRVYCVSSGLVELGFTDANGAFYNNDFHVSRELTAQEDAYTIKVSSTWDGKGDFCIKSSGDVYIDLLSLTDKPLENFMITTSTSIEQDAQRISLLGKKVNGVEGSVTNLGIELNAAEERITAYVDKEVEGVGNTVSELKIEVGEIDLRVTSAKGSADNAQKAADAAQKLADEALSEAVDAQKTADANTSLIRQTQSDISAVVAAFQEDANGNLVLTSAAGAVITSEMAKIYATQDGVTAELATKVSFDPKTGKVTSQIILSADQINLDGAVTYSMLNSSLKTTLDDKLDKSDLDGYATDSELEDAKSELNTAITNLNTTLSTKIDKKAESSSVTSLTTKVNELNTALSGKADSSKLGSLAYIDDVANAALSGSTLIVNGYLNTDYCKVKTIEATKGTIGGFDIGEKSLTNNAGDVSLSIGNLTGTKFVALNNEYALRVRYDGATALSAYSAGTNGIAIQAQGQTGALAIRSVGSAEMIARTSESITISGLALAYRKGTTFTGASNTDVSTGWVDFLVATGNFELPSASSSEGKILFVKANGTRTITSASPIVNCDGTGYYGTNSEGKYSKSLGSTALFYLSDGSVWYEFRCI